MNKYKRLALMFGLPFVVYALFAWDRVLQPSEQFHFVDLAASFLSGRLGTDTPTQSGATKRPEDRRGYREAIRRVKSGGGWNDWASFHEIKLKGGETVRGVWPWGDQTGGKEKHFRTLDGTPMIVDKALDIAKDCGKSGRSKCDTKIHYVSFPPFPAVVMMPLVAVFGYQVNDVILTLLFAAANVLLLFLLLEMFSRRGISRRGSRENLVLALLFAFGTAHFFSSVRGEVWFTALVMGVTMNLLFIMAATETRHPILAGLLLACGFLTRTPILFGGGVYFAAQLFFPGGRWLGHGWATTIRKGLLFAAPLLPLFGLALVYNAVRFGSPLEFGHTYLQDGMRPSVRDHGLMSFHFLNRNLAAAFVNGPRLQAAPPFLKLTRHGLGLFWTTPVFLLLLRLRRFDHWTRVLLAAVAVTAVPLLLYQNTGWAQFTYRFSLDLTPYLFLLLALDDRPLDRKFHVLMAIAIVVQAFGAASFGRAGMFFYD